MSNHAPCGRGGVAVCFTQGVTIEIDPADETCGGCGETVPDFRAAVEVSAIGAHALGDWDRERACLDWLHLHDKAHQGA